MPFRLSDSGTMVPVRTTNRPSRMGCPQAGMGAASHGGPRTTARFAGSGLSTQAAAALAAGALSGDRAARFAMEAVQRRGLGDVNLGMLGSALGSDVSAIFGTVGALTGSGSTLNLVQQQALQQAYVNCNASGGTFNVQTGVCTPPTTSTTTILLIVLGLAVVGGGIALASKGGRSSAPATTTTVRANRGRPRRRSKARYWVQHRKAA